MLEPRRMELDDREYALELIYAIIFIFIGNILLARVSSTYAQNAAPYSLWAVGVSSTLHDACSLTRGLLLGSVRATSDPAPHPHPTPTPLHSPNSTCSNAPAPCTRTITKAIANRGFVRQSHTAISAIMPIIACGRIRIACGTIETDTRASYA